MNELNLIEHRVLLDAIHDSATVVHKGRMMNERIKLLAEQAGITMFGDAVYMSNMNDTLDVSVMKKFAELIGRECLTLADSIRDDCHADGSSEQALGAAWVGLAIARHFGFEE